MDIFVNTQACPAMVTLLNSLAVHACHTVLFRNGCQRRRRIEHLLLYLAIYPSCGALGLAALLV